MKGFIVGFCFLGLNLHNRILNIVPNVIIFNVFSKYSYSGKMVVKQIMPFKCVHSISSTHRIKTEVMNVNGGME